MSRMLLRAVLVAYAAFFISAINPHTVFCESSYDIKEMTPEVKSALENRKNRYEQLRQLKSQGIVGEGNRGYVVALIDDASAKSLVASENNDRKSIYRAIEQQNNLTNALETIEKVFAQVQKDKAAAGDKIQNEDGSWVIK
ncbi:MAG: YdbL family protein [Candidatus Omnitrophota bacterium]